MTPQWAAALQQFERWQLESGIAPSTVRRRRFPLQRFAQHHPAGPGQVTDAGIDAFMATTQSSYTLRNIRDALASFYRWAEHVALCPYPAALIHATRVRAARAVEHGVGRDLRWSAPVAQWLDWLRAGGLSAEMVKLRTYQVARLSRELTGQDPWTVTSDDLAAWLAGYPDWSRETLRSYRSMLRSFYGWAHASGLVKTDPSRLLRKVPPAHTRPRPAAEAVVEHSQRSPARTRSPPVGRSAGYAAVSRSPRQLPPVTLTHTGQGGSDRLSRLRERPQRRQDPAPQLHPPRVGRDVQHLHLWSLVQLAGDLG